MQRCKAEPYNGDLPYLFISYSHKEEDKAIVYPFIERLEQAGFRLWYDQGIESTREWADVVSTRLQNASAVLFCLSKNFAASQNCLDELYLAKNKISNRISLIVESGLQLSPALELALVRQQQIFLENYQDIAELVNVLKKEKNLQACLGSSPSAQKDIQPSLRLNLDRLHKELQDETLLAAKQAYKACEFQNAMDLFRKAYANGNSTAGALLAEMFYDGCYCVQDYDRAVSIFIDCMHRGNPLAAEMLAHCYLHGYGVPKNEEKARSLFAGCQDALEEMAIFGSDDAQYVLGYDFLYGCFTALNQERGVYWLQKAEAVGCDMAGYHLIKARLAGSVSHKDISDGINELYRYTKTPQCAYQFALFMQKGIGGVRLLEEPRFKLLLYAAQKGHLQAQHDLGDWYRLGKGTSVDYAESLFWYQKAAYKGDCYSLVQLGQQYLLAQGVSQDTEKAISFFERADQKGNAYGARMLGYIYCGLYTSGPYYKDLPKAILYLQHAVDRGDKPALEKLLNCYHGDFGKEIQDISKYCALLQKAANQGDAFSIYLLGRALVEGSGEPILPKDTARGNILIEQAVQCKDLNAMLYQAKRFLSAKPYRRESALSLMSNVEREMVADGTDERHVSTDILYKLGYLHLLLMHPYPFYLIKESFILLTAQRLTPDQKSNLRWAYRFFVFALLQDNTLNNALYWMAFLQLTYGFKNDTWDDAALLEWLKKKVPTDPSFASLLGYYYGEHNDEEAMTYWYKIVAQSSRAAACYFARCCIALRAHGKDAMKVLEPWLDTQNPEVTYLVGCLYRYGFGVAKDRAKAKEFLRKAAEHGSKEAADGLKPFWF